MPNSPQKTNITIKILYKAKNRRFLVNLHGGHFRFGPNLKNVMKKLIHEWYKLEVGGYPWTGGYSYGLEVWNPYNGCFSHLHPLHTNTDSTDTDFFSFFVTQTTPKSGSSAQWAISFRSLFVFLSLYLHNLLYIHSFCFIRTRFIRTSRLKSSKK